MVEIENKNTLTQCRKTAMLLNAIPIYQQSQKTTQRNATQPNPTRHNAMQHNPTQYNAIQNTFYK